jgi:hypothetical protein
VEERREGRRGRVRRGEERCETQSERQRTEQTEERKKEERRRTNIGDRLQNVELIKDQTAEATATVCGQDLLFI